jgi:heme/copper-type cytochrome/quinol oxidase subunit 3
MSDSLRLVHPPPVRDGRHQVPNAVLGVMMFVGVEIMMFAGMISAFGISRSQATVWPPPGQPRLPVEATAVNTAVLLLSGVLLYVANRKYTIDPLSIKTPFLVSILCGAYFILAQGYEWIGLIAEGLTLTSSNQGSFFYLIVGAHGLHALVGLVVQLYVYRRFVTRTMSSEAFWAGQVFWYFVVGLWPILYWMVYL